MKTFLALLLALSALLICGCATLDETELPWATPQRWEGTPGIPGLNQD